MRAYRGPLIYNIDAEMSPTNQTWLTMLFVIILDSGIEVELVEISFSSPEKDLV